MTPQELEAKGRALYEACPSVKPGWLTLGPNCKSVWIEYVEKSITPADYQTKEKKCLTSM